MDLKTWAPRKILNIPEDKPGLKVSGEYWSNLWRVSIEQGDYGQDTLEAILTQLYDTVWHATEGAVSITNPAIYTGKAAATTVAGQLTEIKNDIDTIKSDLNLTAWHPTDAAATITNPQLFPGVGGLDVSSQLFELKAYIDQVISDLGLTAWHPTDGAASISNPELYVAGATTVHGQLLELLSHMDTAEANIGTQITRVDNLYNGVEAAYNSDRLGGQLPVYYGTAAEIADLQSQINSISAGAISAFSHNDISNRDAIDAHPISAITGLPTVVSDLYALDDELHALESTLNTTVSGLKHNTFADRNDANSHVTSAIQHGSLTLAQKLANIDGIIASITGDVSELTHTDLAGRDDVNQHPISAITGLQTELNSKAPVLTGAATTIAASDLPVNTALISNASGKVAASTISSTKLGYLSDVTSAIQTQLNAKQATITGGATTIASSNLTASRALVSDAGGKVAVAAVTSTALGYLDGVTSAIQTQLNAKQATITGGASTVVSSNLTASRALASDASGKISVATTTLAQLQLLTDGDRTRKITVGTANPSGGASGDVYIKYA